MGKHAAVAWTVERWETIAQPDVICFGQSDDHLRLVTLLAERIGRGSSANHDAVETCHSPKSTWRQRIDALQILFGTESAKHLVILDLDALYPGPLTPEIAWDDKAFHRERSKIFQLLLDRAGANEWSFLRTAGNPVVTERLREADITIDAKPESNALAVPTQIAPEVRPLARWLLESKILDRRQLERFVTSVSDINNEIGGEYTIEDNVLWTVYDCLPQNVRETAHQVALLRPDQPRNGHFGPFLLSNTTNPVPGTLRSRDIDMLHKVGILQGTPERLRVPRLIRMFLVQRAEGNLGSLVAQHERLANTLWHDSKGSADKSMQGILEAHHHAILGQNIALALETAKYYASDLRSLAYQLSQNKEYRKAAEIYRTIVDRFDPHDAYAWEYLGYNLIQSRIPGEFTASQRRAIEHAYEQAHRLEPHNPLYHGRLLGFRAQCGMEVGIEVLSELERGVRKYEQTDDGERAVSYFARPVLQGLRRGSQHQALEKAEELYAHRVDDYY